MKIRRSSLFILLMLCLFVAQATACPTCKDALASGNSADLVRGFGWSIIFMMAMPFLILGGIGAYFYYEIRKARPKTTTPRMEPVWSRVDESSRMAT